MGNDNINSNERFTRWQQILREHLSYLNNLILTFSIGIFGYLLSQLKDKEFQPVCCEKLFFTFGILTIILSIIIGMTTSFCRLLDFRTTVKKIKNEIKGNYNELDDLKHQMDLYSKATWIFLKTQIILFFISSILLSISFLLIYNEKLF